ncbi:MAG: hypothetical protein QF645_05375 [Planctomycetota bacterium]|nr:hypothetical protein [Planctomycetota bacterium]
MGRNPHDEVKTDAFVLLVASKKTVALDGPLKSPSDRAPAPDKVPIDTIIIFEKKEPSPS